MFPFSPCRAARCALGLAAFLALAPVAAQAEADAASATPFPDSTPFSRVQPALAALLPETEPAVRRAFLRDVECAAWRREQLERKFRAARREAGFGTWTRSMELYGRSLGVLARFESQVIAARVSPRTAGLLVSTAWPGGLSGDRDRRIRCRDFLRRSYLEERAAAAQAPADPHAPTYTSALD